MRLPAIFRKAAELMADDGPRVSLEFLTDDAFDLWMSFRRGESCTPREAVLGLLLLAEILESAE